MTLHKKPLDPGDELQSRFIVLSAIFCAQVHTIILVTYNQQHEVFYQYRYRSGLSTL